jgi:hypothetical protein
MQLVISKFRWRGLTVELEIPYKKEMFKKHIDI